MTAIAGRLERSIYRTPAQQAPPSGNPEMMIINQLPQRNLSLGGLRLIEIMVNDGATPRIAFHRAPNASNTQLIQYVNWIALVD
jgi:hypothetical protein